MLAKWLRLLVVTLFIGVPVSSAAPVDTLRVRQLESEVNRLQRELSAQARRIDELERAVRKGGSPRAAAGVSDRTGNSPAWLVSTNWDRLRPGMKEVDVIALLGRPTSVRTDDAGEIRAFWYAMEIGPTIVLAGNVQLDENGVAKINRPALR
jgi:hypothetical protein